MKIKHCRSCESKNLIEILSLGNQYLSDFTKNKIKQKSFPLNIVLCRKCSLVQLNYTTPAKYLYTERYGYKSGINQTMRDELKGIAKGRQVEKAKVGLTQNVGGTGATVAVNIFKRN